MRTNPGFGAARVRAAAPLFLLGVLSILTVGVLLISRMPDVYESGSRLAMERPESTTEQGAAFDQDSVNQRLHLIIGTVLSRPQIEMILREHEMMEPMATERDIVDAVAKFRDDALIEFDNVPVINQYTGKFGLLPLGLTISYRDESPERAQAVARTLTDTILEINEVKLDRKTGETEQYLRQQLEKTQASLQEVEQEIATFKNENSLLLPDLQDTLVRRISELEFQLERSEDSLSALRRDAASTAAELAITSPDAMLVTADGRRIESTAERLEQLQMQYAAASSRYSGEHPTVVALRQEIAALERIEGGSATSELERRLGSAQSSLNELLQRYTDQHPDVQARKREIAAIRESISAAERRPAPSRRSVSSNPAYNRVLIKQQSLDMDITREQDSIATYRRQLENSRSQLELMPEVERQLLGLERRRERAVQLNSELEAQLLDTELSVSRRRADLAERIIPMEMPRLPLEPVSPRRKLLYAVLALFALLASLTAAVLQQIWRGVIWDRRDVESMIDTAIVPVPRFRKVLV